MHAECGVPDSENEILRRCTHCAFGKACVFCGAPPAQRKDHPRWKGKGKRSWRTTQQVSLFREHVRTCLHGLSNADEDSADTPSDNDGEGGDAATGTVDGDGVNSDDEDNKDDDDETKAEAHTARTLTRSDVRSMKVQLLKLVAKHLNLPTQTPRPQLTRAIIDAFPPARGATIKVPLPTSASAAVGTQRAPSQSRTPVSSQPAAPPTPVQRTYQGTLPANAVPRLFVEDIKYHCTRRGIPLSNRTAHGLATPRHPSRSAARQC